MEYSELCEKCEKLQTCETGQNKNLPEFGHIKPICYKEKINDKKDITPEQSYE